MAASDSMIQPIRSRRLWRLAGASPRLAAAIMAFIGWGIHLSILPDQAALWWGYGLFFFVVAMLQGALGVSLVFDEPGLWTVLWGAGISFALVIVWFFTRVGTLPPWGSFIPLPVDALSTTATVCEALLVLLLPLLGLRKVRGT